MNLAPIVLFVYNRPWHTQQTLEALAKNTLANESELFIFCDGPKDNVNEDTLKSIAEVRIIAQAYNGCKQTTIIKSETNKGLANSIINGVTKIVNEYGKIIVLEDDIVCSKGFLKYMNDALAMYENEEKVGCIHGWNYNIAHFGYRESTFFLKGADCWGWATWKPAWNLFNPNGSELLKQITYLKQEFSFNRNGTHPFLQMLQDQIDSKNDSWAIRWHASLFVKEKYCLQPTKPIVTNIGLDNSGTHCDNTYYKQKPTENIIVNKIKIRESSWFFKSYSNIFVKKIPIWEKLKIYVFNVFHQY